jgi:uncharacterized delta-60 repeat protein
MKYCILIFSFFLSQYLLTSEPLTFFNTVAIQSDSRIMVAGTQKNAGIFSIITNRYTATGVLDPSFNVIGSHLVTISSNTQAVSLTLQADNKIIVTGSVVENGVSDIVLIRFNTDGTRDNTFGTNGIARLSHGEGIMSYQSIISGSTTVTVGEVVLQGKRTPTIIRTLNDGSLDTTFGSTGIVTTPLSQAAAFSSVAQQSTGRLIAGGMLHDREWIFIGYTSTGSIDTTFGINGIQIIELGRDARLNHLILDSDTIIACGKTLSHITLVRLTANGTLDTSFGTNGIVRTIVENQSSANSITLESPSNNLVVSGFINQNLATIKYLSNGTIDTTFGDQGIVSIPTDNVVSSDLAVGLTNNIINASNENTLGLIVNLNSDGTINRSFGIDGIVHFPSQIPVLGNNYLAAYSTTTQVVTNSFSPLSFNVFGPIDGWETSGETTFICKKGGVYWIKISAGYTGVLGIISLTPLTLRATLNGNEITGSQVSSTMGTTALQRQLLETSFIVTLASEDQIMVEVLRSGTVGTIQVTPDGGGTTPIAASISIQRIA